MVLLPNVLIATGTLAAVAAGFLGGITGVILMHRIKPFYVRHTMIALLSLAILETVMKMASAKVSEILHIVSIGIILAGLLVFICAIARRLRERRNALPAP
jgi:uncharacterized membrane protein